MNIPMPFRRCVRAISGLLLTLILVVGCGRVRLDGTIAFASYRDGIRAIYLMTADGSDVTRLTANPEGDKLPALSPDGTHVAYTSYRDGNDDIYIVDVAGATPIRLTTHPETDTHAAWSPDGTHLVFESHRDGNSEIYKMQANGTNLTNLTQSPADDSCPAWSPDGHQIAFLSYSNGVSDIYLMQPDGSKRSNLTQHPAVEGCPTWSPDGTHLVFSALNDDNDDDKDGIYMIEANGTGRTEVVSDWGFVAFDDPTWSPDGTYIAFTYRHYRGQVYENIHAIRPDGTGRIKLTTGTASNSHPSWGP